MCEWVPGLLFFCFGVLATCTLLSSPPLPHLLVAVPGRPAVLPGRRSCLDFSCLVLWATSFSTAVPSLVVTSGLYFNSTGSPLSLVPGPFPYPALPRSAVPLCLGCSLAVFRPGPWSPLSCGRAWVGCRALSGLWPSCAVGWRFPLSPWQLSATFPPPALVLFLFFCFWKMDF